MPMPNGRSPATDARKRCSCSRVCMGRCPVSKELDQRRMGSVRLGQDPPLADWLTALSHDSPFAVPQARAVRPDPAPPLAAVPSLLSLLRDADSGVRLRAVAALGDLA